MRNGTLLRSLIVALLLAAGACVDAATQPLLRSAPEAEGVSSQAVREYIEAADRQINTMHSFMLVRHGHVIAEAWWKPEAADKPHTLWSLSKSFNSTAIGLAIAEGKLSLDDAVLKFFPNDAPADPSDNLKAMTVRDLLTMTGGARHRAQGRRRSFRKAVSCSPGHPQARHAFSLQHDGQLHAVGNRDEGDGADDAGFFEAALV